MIGYLATIFIGTFFITAVIFIFFVSWKEIFFSLKKFFNKRGCWAYIFTPSRSVEQHFQTPDDYHFRIGGEIYVTNPEKCLDLNPEHLNPKNVESSMKKAIQKYDTQISGLLVQKQEITNKFKRLVMSGKLDEAANENILTETLSKIDQQIKDINAKKSNIGMPEKFSINNRPAFFYVKGDPVPKSFYELYSEVDSRILDNLAARAATKPENMSNNKMFELIKWAAIAAAGAAIIAIIIGLRTQTMITELAASMGATIPV